MAQLSYWKVLTRRKILQTTSDEQESESKLNRVFSTFDLTALGVGATLGVGVYVLAGHVAKDQAGPSVTLSFAIAALTSLLAGLCYAEFGARVPKAGSAYVYSYVCIGELAAFVIGWNLILEYIIGSASVSRGISLYLDSIINDTLKTSFMATSPIGWGFLGPYFDFFAFATAFIFGVTLAFGIQASTILNNCFTVINIGVVLFVIIAGSMKASFDNWTIDPRSVNDTTGYNLGAGGFFPFGFEGTLKGAATCFFGFVGFDCIATTGEEVKNPSKAIPRAILFSLCIIFLSYFGVSTVLTLMWPYYKQDVDAPLPYVFQQIGWPVAKWIVTVGGMIGLIASLIGAMFPLPRIIYAMSQDKLIFKFLGKVDSKYKTPIVGTICASFLTGLFAGLFDLTQLVNMLSIGTLMAYTVVALSITILRFMDNEAAINRENADLNENSHLNGTGSKITIGSSLKQIFNFKCISGPTALSTRVVGAVLCFYCLCCLGFSLTVKYAGDEIASLEPVSLTVLIIFIFLIILSILSISVQPRETTNPIFHVPFLPLIPAVSIFVNIYLMLQLDIYTWIRFGIWMVIGLPIYFTCICMRKTSKFEEDNWTLKHDTKPYVNGDINNKSPPAVAIVENSISHNDDGRETNENSQDIWNNKLNHQNNGNGELITKVEIHNESLQEESTTDDLENDESALRKENGIEIPNGKINLAETKVLSVSETFDEIIPASELSENVKEIRNPSGKICFIEDKNVTNKDQETFKEDEDAKSVIAILDNVLQREDSFDSENQRVGEVTSSLNSTPDRVQTSTIAVIHSNSDDDEEGKEKLEENSVVDINEKIPAVNNNEIISNDHNTEQNSQEENPLATLTNNNSSDGHTSRKNSVKDAFHSNTFKEKLSQIICKPPPSTLPLKSLKRPKDQHNQVSSDNSELEYPRPRPVFKTSKSESDLQILNNLNSPSLSIQPDEDVPQKITGTGETTDSNSNSIPKPPKFDPILFKTLTTRHRPNRERPRLDSLVSNNNLDLNDTEKIFNSSASNETKEKSLLNENDNSLPFKEKLEILLKRRQVS